MKTTFPVLPALCVLLLIAVPFLIAVAAGGQNLIFTGFLLNPADGASYLAKIQQGMQGSWHFTLPYTAEVSSGAHIFLFYLFLGHVARFFQLTPLFVFHAARLIAAVWLLAVLYRAVQRTYPGQLDSQRLGFWLAALGTGLGWTVIFLGVLPVDFWVAEAYPFLSMLANPHFPLGLAVLLEIFLILAEEEARYRILRLALLGVVLSICFHFGVVVALVTGAGVSLWNSLEKRRLVWQPLTALGMLSGPLLVWQYWAMLRDPLLAGWTAQNETLTPALYNVLVSFSPAFFFALAAVVQTVREKKQVDPYRRVWMIWAAAGLLLAYAPFGLQRRFLLGLQIPLAFLAVDGVGIVRCWLAERMPKLAQRLGGIVLSLSLPSSILLLVIALSGAAGRSPVLYLTRGEMSALEWLAANTPEDAVVLASPEMGRWIPAFGGRRVVYGHPYETVNAEVEEARVQAFFASPGWTPEHTELIEERGVDYLLYGPRETALGGSLDVSDLPLLFASDDARVFRVP